MKSRIILIGIFLSSFLSLIAQQYVVLLMNERSEELVVLSRKEIRDILTIDHRYLGRAEAITPTGITASFQHYHIDSIHSIVVKHGNLGAKLGLPFKVVGVGLAALGGLMIKAGAEQPSDDQFNSGDTGLFVGGVLALGAGFGSFMLGKGIGNRPIEKEKTTYYFHQWKVKIVDRRHVVRYKSAMKS